MSLEHWKNSAAYKRINWNGQMGRVINVLAGYQYLTLREIEARIRDIELAKKRENSGYKMSLDTQAAISARIREVSPCRHGLVKQKTMEVVEGKQVWRYRLLPAVSIKRVAEMIGVVA
ncbi:hypothetical protein [Vibrio sp. HA2012]|uniref:hypothetical protein n=1 Tax=Vibrio sp. HA2012 TaxID=1971595 RepID=UPI0018E20DB3|nr:hypothetical protein [Vibrio sp. HA2012]